VSDLAELYLVLVLVYWFECASVVPRSALGLVRQFGRWRVRRTFAPSSTWSRGFVFGEAWPPLSSALVTEPLPLIVGPDGLSAEGEFVPWEKVQQVAAEATRLVVNGDMTVLFATRRGALALAEACDGLPGQPRQERERRLRRWLNARFDADAIEARLPPMRRETLPIRIAASVLWAAVFLGLPVLLWTPLATFLLAIGAVAVAAWITAAVLFERALRRSRWLVPGLRPDLAKRIAAVASPLATMRACDHFGRELAGDLDPLAAAAPLLAEAELSAIGRTRLADLKYGRDGAPPAGGESDAGWLRRELTARVERTLRARDIDPDRLLAPPERDGPDVIAWCPRCRAQYRGGEEAPRACANHGCGGITLCAFDQAGGATPASQSPA
jgi:hypothetical protein